MRKILRSPSAEWEPAKGIAPLQTSLPLNGGTSEFEVSFVVRIL
jgi:hypothetical protein